MTMCVLDALPPSPIMIPVLMELLSQLHPVAAAACIDSEPLERQHVLRVESHHPYSDGTKEKVHVVFPESTHWMLVELDSQTCSTCQPEDHLTICSEDDVQLFRAFHGANGSDGVWPSRPLAVPGSRLALDFGTATNYAKSSDDERFGFACTVTGFQSPNQSLWQVEQESVLILGRIASELCSLGNGEQEQSTDVAALHSLWKNGLRAGGGDTFLMDFVAGADHGAEELSTGTLYFTVFYRYFNVILLLFYLQVRCWRGGWRMRRMRGRKRRVRSVMACCARVASCRRL